MTELQRTSCPQCGAAVQGRAETCNHCGFIFAKPSTDSPSFDPQLDSGTDSGASAQSTPQRCQVCGSQAPTTQVVFRQNIGAVIMRFSKTLDADLCSSCVWKSFGKYTLVTAAVGWCGLISFFVAPVFVVLNVVNLTSARRALARAKSGTGGLVPR